MIESIDMEDYTVNDEDDDLMVAIKEAIAGLRPVERKIWLTYAETGSYAATARVFNVSPPTAKSYLVKVRNKILKNIDDVY